MPTKFEQITPWEKSTNYCSHPEHSPPSHIVVPNGQRMVHTCPACGQVQIVYPVKYTL